MRAQLIIFITLLTLYCLSGFSLNFQFNGSSTEEQHLALEHISDILSSEQVPSLSSNPIAQAGSVFLSDIKDIFALNQLLKNYKPNNQRLNQRNSKIHLKINEVPYTLAKFNIIKNQQEAPVSYTIKIWFLNSNSNNHFSYIYFENIAVDKVPHRIIPGPADQQGIWEPLEKDSFSHFSSSSAPEPINTIPPPNEPLQPETSFELFEQTYPDPSAEEDPLLQRSIIEFQLLNELSYNIKNNMFYSLDTAVFFEENKVYYKVIYVENINQLKIILQNHLAFDNIAMDQEFSHWRHPHIPINVYVGTTSVTGISNHNNLNKLTCFLWCIIINNKPFFYFKKISA